MSKPQEQKVISEYRPEEQDLISDYLSEIGRKGGSVTGRRAGRKPIPDEERTPAQKKRREYYEKERNRSR